MSKHTPGPWSFDETHCFIYDRDDHHVGQAYKIWLNDKQQDRERALANARLIAAAPELLEALKACSAELLMLHTDRSGTEECIQQAYAAITKAEGEINE